MRELKFRYWISGMGKMLFTKDLAQVTMLGAVNSNNGKIEIMQFTGLKDKNCKEIYEGDVLKETNDYDGGEEPSVRYYLVKFGFYDFTTYNEDQGYGYYLVRIGKYPDEGQGIYEGEMLEVVGNLHENPELIKGVENND